ncbi:subtilisin-like protease SBT5.3 isoform X2 [Cucurbita moschata]|uniref:Subtilisin-like protease SBT5.3 isoform X2 n=1 Tax=Cucurbita moschata TaxID=3662 RepID=A0A6J1EWA7_CUCMO|nr:subtilisin-like protease SBT5.3 isoform X2 [Cucurbita moschata]
MEAFNLPPLLLPFFLFALLQTSTIAAQKSYIVYLGSHSHGLNPSALDLQLVTQTHYNLLGSVLGSNEAAKESIFYSYNKNINGFAAVLEHKVAEDIAKHPDVISVYENKGLKLHTTRSWNFLGVENDGGIPSDSLWNLSRFGESTIIGNIDTGVWPESKSFSDEGYGPIPTRWKGSCEGGSNFRCNRKLIGARYFNKGYISSVEPRPLNSSYETARDYDGHGTHTLSTAGGNFVPGVSIFGNGYGTAKGGSPNALVAAYKVCWPPTLDGECFMADVLAGFEAAISDGVDILSVSLGEDAFEFSEDLMAIGSFHAVKNGITVVCSAGNSGLFEGSVSNVAPWMITVGASTIDRLFTTYVALGDNRHFKGESLSSKILPFKKFYPLIRALDAASDNISSNNSALCLKGSLDPKKVKGKIVVCLNSYDSEVDKGYEAAQAGAVGMILVNDEESGDDLWTAEHLLPASHVSYIDGESINHYIQSTITPMAYITRVKTELGIKPAPIMASFSSRGPNRVEPSILKPDITAPGVNILAAFSGKASPTDSPFDKRRVLYNVLSGTSMSCPHISGIVGLLKTLYPKWSPAAIKSAIMTTAETEANDLNPILNSEKEKANPLAYGAGHIQPNKAANPGLIYDLSTQDYLNFLCVRGYNKTQMKLFTNDTSFVCSKSFTVTDLNYPSISMNNLKSEAVEIKRRVKNVGSPSTYVAQVEAPPGVSVSVNPSTLKFTKTGEEKDFKVVLRRVPNNQTEGYMFGKLVWSNGNHHVSSPIFVTLERQ